MSPTARDNESQRDSHGKAGGVLLAASIDAGFSPMKLRNECHGGNEQENFSLSPMKDKVRSAR